MNRLTLYDIAYLIVGTLALPWVVARKGRMPDGWRIRWGRYPAQTHAALARCRGGVWLHAVSLGEAKAAAPLVQALHERYPDLPLVLTAVTRTGHEALTLLAGARDAVTYVPFDLSRVLDRFLDLTRPRLVVLLEQELWPGLVWAAGRRGVPIVVANGRLSERSAVRYRAVGWLARRLLRRVDQFLMQSEADRERLVRLGVAADRALVVGNLKYDNPSVSDAQRRVAQARRSALGMAPHEILWIAGSTHCGEEAIVISVYRALRARGVPLRLLVAPRHVERVAEVERVARAAGLTPVRLSALQEHPTQDTRHKTQDVGSESRVTSHESRVTGHRSQVTGQGSNVEGQRSKVSSSPLAVWILDTSGELSQWYGVADIAFVGGSLIPHGGQNVLEPAAWALPIATGPHLANFAAIAEAFAREEACRVVTGERELTEAVEQWARSPQHRRATGERAQAVSRAAAGATARVMAVLADYLVARDSSLVTRDSSSTTSAHATAVRSTGVYEPRATSHEPRSVVEQWQRRLAPALVPLSWLYGAAVWLVREGYRRGALPRHRLSRPVISVGNLTWGGTGKTPLVAWVAQALRRHGSRVVVLSRGYRDRAGVGADEARMLGAQIPDVPVVTGRDRVRSGRRAIARYDPDVVLLDDGFQHWRLRRDLDAVAVDARAPWGSNGRLIPAGSLREAPAALGRADLIVVTKSDQVEPERLATLREQIQRLNDRAIVATARYRVVDIIRLSDGALVGVVGEASAESVEDVAFQTAGHKTQDTRHKRTSHVSRPSRSPHKVPQQREDTLWGETSHVSELNGPVALVAGIADPASFERLVATLGCDVTWRCFFDDHHPYRRRDLEAVAAQCRQHRIGRVLTTEKDAVKVRRWPELLAAPEWTVVRVRLEVDDDDGALVARLAACGRRSRR